MTASLRTYGRPPFRVALIHGGPGAAGEMTPVAVELARPDAAGPAVPGVLEPLQTALTVDGQVEELRLALEQHATLPVVLVGHSWGAWLAWILAARHRDLVAKLVLVSSGPFQERYAKALGSDRRDNLSEADKAELEEAQSKLASRQSPAEVRSQAFQTLGRIMSKADAYDPIEPQPGETTALEVRFDIYEAIWPEAAALRRSGELIELASQISCPVVAIHGDHDPHPWQGVQEPLESRSLTSGSSSLRSAAIVRGRRGRPGRPSTGFCGARSFSPPILKELPDNKGNRAREVRW